MSSQGVLYLLIGMKHAARAVVSLTSLRQHYQGEIAILTDEPDGVPGQIANDLAIGARIVNVPAFVRQRHACYTFKSQVHRHTPFEHTLFLDCDTLVCQPIAYPLAVPSGLVLTQFSSWVSNRRPIVSRILRWKDTAPKLVERALSRSEPAINTGVFAFDQSVASELDRWHELTRRLRIFICDEIAMQILYPELAPVTVLDDRFNCSPVHGVHQDDVVIWHGHGGKFLRPRTRKLWLDHFWHCYAANIGGIKEWMPLPELMTYRGE